VLLLYEFPGASSEFNVGWAAPDGSDDGEDCRVRLLAEIQKRSNKTVLTDPFLDVRPESQRVVENDRHHASINHHHDPHPNDFPSPPSSPQRVRQLREKCGILSVVLRESTSPPFKFASSTRSGVVICRGIPRLIVALPPGLLDRI
jgi:hypothetical protein